MDPASGFFSSWFLVVLIGIVTLYLLKCLTPRSKSDIKGKYVLITGCDSGFGRETAIRLDRMGVCVLATCLTKEGEQSLKSVASDRLKTYQMDVTNSQQIQDVHDEVKRQIPADTGLWGLVNNAGILYLLPIEWTPLSIFKRTADVNLWGMIDVTKTFLPLVKKARGRVVNFASIAGRLSFNFYSSYTVIKYGVEAFSDVLRREMYPWGIKVSILEPGGFSTNMCNPRVIGEQINKGWNELTEELKEEYGEEFLNKGIAFWTRHNANFSHHISLVVDAVTDALTSQNPRDRYLVGLSAQVFVWIARLPTAVADFFVRMFSNLPAPRGSKWSNPGAVSLPFIPAQDQAD